ncbi:hypothetical protein HS088_TW14G01059 [Tripterygium wilfordii]|uniref:Uncharacterized protein n=1 Tax=Tripterygium wilfordii TaxID=458696 RepID=A0A7J7CS77_TRIWF|nr:hypothetical protein HS088_TW14G01059 [Tripterygium wilfordii]
MGTEVLRPQDCLIERIRGPPVVFHHRRRAYNGSPNPIVNSNPRSNYRKPAVRFDRSEQKRRSQSEQPPSVSKRSSSVEDLRAATVARSNNYGNTNASRSNVNLVMENVTILRRGQSLDSQIKRSEAASKKENNGGMMVTGTDRLGPDPEKVPKHTWIVDLMSPLVENGDVYAGSAFAMSPSPSSLPLPSFSKKKQLTVDDSATRDLRRLLRLD